MTAPAPRRVAIVQSNYIPWRGYFDLMNHVDAFVLLDDVQYTRRDWRNRNRIKTVDGPRWLSIPVQTKGGYEQRIDETRIADPAWRRSHWSAIEQAYRRAPHFEAIAAALAPLYAQLDAQLLSDVNAAFLQRVRELLAIDTPMTRSADYATGGERSRRLLDICLATGATEYVSGPAARGYLDVELFARAGVDVAWFDYAGYPAYAQLHGAFEPRMSIVDLLFCEGPASRDFLLTTRSSPPPAAPPSAPLTPARARARRAAAGAAAAAALTGAALGVGGCGGDDGQPRATDDGAPVAGASKSFTLSLQSQLTSITTATGTKPGAPLTFTAMLFAVDAKTASGRSQAACTRVAPGAGEVFQCTLTYIIRNSTIYGQSTSSPRGPAGGVITGGTGRYAYVRGTFRYRTTGGSRIDLTMRLTK